MTKISQEDCSIRSFKRIINRCGIFFLFLFFFSIAFLSFHSRMEWSKFRSVGNFTDREGDLRHYHSLKTTGS